MDFLSRLKVFFTKFKNPRYRNRRAWYASSLLADARDLYWEASGEPVTDSTDFSGHMRMNFGKWIEEGFMRDVVRQMHWFGLHAVGTGKDQISIGGSGVDVDGYLDALLVERTGDSFGKPYVFELKTAYGFGADLTMRNGGPKEEHLAQIGYYLYDLNSKGITNRGILFYLFLSDANFSEALEIEIEYQAATREIVALRSKDSQGQNRVLDMRMSIDPILERLKKIEGYVARKELPPAEHFYKYPLTPEFLAGQTDYALLAAIDGKKILGDWQIRYSKFFQKHLAAEGSTREYTENELRLLEAEYLSRHPRSKKFKKGA